MDRSEDIIQRSQELDTGDPDCFNRAHPASEVFWERGATAFLEGVLLEHCPFEAGIERDDWLRGWMATELLEFGRFEDGS